MKSDRTTPMTPRIARKLAELGIVLPPETTIHEANRILSQAVQPKKQTLDNACDEIFRESCKKATSNLKDVVFRMLTSGTKKPIDNPVLEKVRGVDITWKRLDTPPVSSDEAIANIQRILQKAVDTGAGQIIGGEEDNTPTDASDCICKGPRSNPANCPKCCRGDEE